MFKSQPAVEACGNKCVPAARAPEGQPQLAQKFSRELMKMLSRLVTLR